MQYLIFISLIVYTFLALHDNLYFCACSVADNSDWLQNKSFLPTAVLLAQEETSKAPCAYIKKLNVAVFSLLQCYFFSFLQIHCMPFIFNAFLLINLSYKICLCVVFLFFTCHTSWKKL